VTLGWVETFVAGYFARFAGIAKWRQASVAGAGAGKQVTTRIGRMIHIPDNATDTSLFCLPVQTNRSDGFKLALVIVSEKLNGLDARIVHTRHDEIIFEARYEIADQPRYHYNRMSGGLFLRNHSHTEGDTLPLISYWGCGP
jgi:DNA polymerase I-like protein with 3'-5' exonuclease and polymerase domains